MNKTINRGWIKRQIEQGKMEATNSYRFEPMDDSLEYGNGKWLPARVQQAIINEKDITKGYDWIGGYYNFHPHDFKSKSGHCYESDSEKGIYHLIVHSNHCDLLRVKKENENILVWDDNDDECIPCKKCGRKDLPLHYNQQCPECFTPPEKSDLLTPAGCKALDLWRELGHET